MKDIERCLSSEVLRKGENRKWMIQGQSVVVAVAIDFWSA
jgi:hypothetical protein